MKHTVETLRERLYAIIRRIGGQLERYARNLDNDCTRKRSLTPAVLIYLILIMGEKSGAGESVSNQVRGHQHRGDRQSGLSSGPPQAGGARHQLHRQNGPSVNERRLRPIRPPDWDGPSKSAEYASDLRRRFRWQNSSVAGLHGPPWRGSRSVVYRRL